VCVQEFYRGLGREPPDPIPAAEFDRAVATFLQDGRPLERARQRARELGDFTREKWPECNVFSDYVVVHFWPQLRKEHEGRAKQRAEERRRQEAAEEAEAISEDEYQHERQRRLERWAQLPIETRQSMAAKVSENPACRRYSLDHDPHGFFLDACLSMMEVVQLTERKAK
jgi:hypothetical protein